MDSLFYIGCSESTEPDKHIASIENLPDDIGFLCQFVQNLLIHAYWLDKYDCKISEATKFTEMQIRNAEDIYEYSISKSTKSLIDNKDPQERVVSICRDFSLILCSILRAKGIPSRTRCGFATYLTAGHFEDHWICEYWSESNARWVMVDAQLDDIHVKTLKIDFNPLDVPSTHFIYAGEAWDLCTTGAQASEKFGILNMTGLPFIKGNLIRDLYALNKIELLGWDTGWGILKEYMTPIESNNEIELLNELAIISKTSDLEKAKSAITFQEEIKLPENWCLSQCPTIMDLYARQG